MLVLIRLYPKGGLNTLWDAIEIEKRYLYWENVVPLYAIQEEGKKYVSIVLDVKSLDSIQTAFMKYFATMTSVRKTKTIPIMAPLYFPLPKGHPKDLVRYQVYLRVSPDKYDDVYSSIISLDYPKDVMVTYLSHSFGDDDIIVSLLAQNREAALKFVNNQIGKIEGVFAHDVSRVLKNIYLQPPEKSAEHRDRFLYSVPAGQKGKLKNPKAYEKYRKEKRPMTVIVRLFAKKTLGKLWEDIEENLTKAESKDLIPLYASQQEGKEFITVVFEAINFEVLKDVLTDNLPTLVDVRKTRTIPMLEPTYFLIPKDHPDDLERYLIRLRVEARKAETIHANIVNYDFPKNVYLTYLTFSLGDDDILLSVLAESRESAQRFAKKAFDKMDGVSYYYFSTQLKTRRLTSKATWKKHQERYLSSYDAQHKEEYVDYDWANDFYEYAAMTGAFVHELED
jgi:DNA-binding Lrp family transcriptional regulator